MCKNVSRYFADNKKDLWLSPNLVSYFRSPHSVTLIEHADDLAQVSGTNKKIIFLTALSNVSSRHIKCVIQEICLKF